MSLSLLTRREKQIAERIAWGSSQKEVADDLHISRWTVDSTLRKVYQKLHIGKVNELSAWWFCTNFGISFELSPLKRTLGALSLLVLFLFGELKNDPDFCRYRGRRISRTEVRIRLKS